MPKAFFHRVFFSIVQARNIVCIWTLSKSYNYDDIVGNEEYQSRHIKIVCIPEQTGGRSRLEERSPITE